jgi:hypothetical protein
VKAHPEDILRTVPPADRPAVICWYAAQPDVHPDWARLALTI